jgi:hypothetical protein
MTKKKKRLELKAQGTDQTDFLDPASTAVAGSVAWFSIKAIAQAIIGWIGLNYYLKARDWWKNRGKVEGETTEVSTEESAASS